MMQGTWAAIIDTLENDELLNKIVWHQAKLAGKLREACIVEGCTRERMKMSLMNGNISTEEIKNFLVDEYSEVDEIEPFIEFLRIHTTPGGYVSIRSLLMCFFLFYYTSNVEFNQQRVAELSATLRQARGCLMNLQSEDNTPIDVQMQKMIHEITKTLGEIPR